MSKSILDGYMICSVTGQQVFSDAVYLIDGEQDLKCPCHDKTIKLTKTVEQIQALDQDPCDYDECPFKGMHKVDGFTFCDIHRNEYEIFKKGVSLMRITDGS